MTDTPIPYSLSEPPRVDRACLAAHARGYVVQARAGGAHLDLVREPELEGADVAALAVAVREWLVLHPPVRRGAP